MSEQHEMHLVIENKQTVNEKEQKDVEKGEETVDGQPRSNYISLPDSSFNLENKDFRHKIWQLITFFRRVFIYFVVVALADSQALDLPSWGRLIFKCLPVFTLSIFVYRQFNSFESLRENKYALLIFIGLTFSYIADGLLVYQDDHTGFFLAGLVTFASAHILYTFAFGWRPIQSRMMIRSLIAAGLVYYYLYTGNLLNSGVGLIIGVAFYIVIIMTMQWRAWARLSYQDITDGRFYKILGALGASFFALSDSILGINKFRFPVPGADYSILATYYVGQLLIALSVIDDQNHQRSQGGEVETDGNALSLNLPTAASMKTTFEKFLNWLIS